ncbi:MAG: hypothetical protein LC731_06580, partial [Acidobacteria bacterium]|nr:hypothetical protein [Acidobacteriota bacterium]
MSDSSLSDAATWQGRSGVEPPPTEIMRPEDMPTAPIETTHGTIGQQRARPTAREVEQQSAAIVVAPRSNATVIALSAIVALLLVALGGLMVWIMMRDRRQTQTRAATSNQESAKPSSTTEPRTASNTNSSANATPQPSPVDVAALQKEVQTALSAWAGTVRQRNLDEHMNYYADVL